MNRGKALKTLRENLYLVSTATYPPMVMDIEKLFLAEKELNFPWDELALMVTLSGKEAYELAKELCPKRRQIALPDGSTRVLSDDLDSEVPMDQPKLIVAPGASHDL